MQMSGRYLVDTNVIIRLLKSDERAVEMFDNADEIYVPVIVAGELFYGAQNSTQKQANMAIFNDFLSQYIIIDIDPPIAEMYGEIKAQLKRSGITIPENDLWIAATAKAKRYKLLTFDNHFENVDGLQVVS